jgi:cytidylate kinase
MKKINIAIDGYSSCGKSTLAKGIAQTLGYTFIDTGAMYRAVTLFALRNEMVDAGVLNEQALIRELPGVDIRFAEPDATGKARVLLNEEDVEDEIRQMHVANHVSAVAGVPEVREKLVALQQKMGEQKGVVMDGRDIGTVVFPKAELKIFMTAEPEVRVQRRLAELKAKGDAVSADDVRKNLEERDYQDTHRAADPLRQAEDALVLDNTNLNKEEQFNLVLEWVNQRLA